jgi:hypothetical protein
LGRELFLQYHRHSGRGKPYYPHTVLWIQQESGQILAGEFFPHQGFEKAFQDHFMALIEKLEAVPQEIRVKK